MARSVIQYVPLAQIEVAGADLGGDWIRVADASDDIGYVAAGGSQDIEIGLSDSAADNPGAIIAAYEPRQSSMTIWQVQRGKYVWIRATGGSNQDYIFRGWTAEGGIPPW